MNISGGSAVGSSSGKSYKGGSIEDAVPSAISTHGTVDVDALSMASENRVVTARLERLPGFELESTIEVTVRMEEI